MTDRGASTVGLDGSFGEGGGQILRTALTCSLLTGRPFTLDRIRAGRRRPGLRPQHLAAVQAAAAMSDAAVAGAELGSRSLTFRPGPVRAGTYSFSIGTAGSTGLVLQTILLPLLEAGASEVTIEGGTHNEGAPPFEFLSLAFIPLLRRMGAELDLQLERHGFHPAGGGRIRLRTGEGTPVGLQLRERGSVRRTEARALVSRLPVSIAERELAVVRDELRWPREALHAEEVEADGPGNAVVLMVESEHVTEVFTGFGRRGIPAETVARTAVARAHHYLLAEVPVGDRLADQLLLPLAWAGGGSFVTSEPTSHFRTNAFVLGHFFAGRIEVTPADGTVIVEYRAP